MYKVLWLDRSIARLPRSPRSLLIILVFTGSLHDQRQWNWAGSGRSLTFDGLLAGADLVVVLLVQALDVDLDATPFAEQRRLECAVGRLTVCIRLAMMELLVERSGRVGDG